MPKFWGVYISLRLTIMSGPEFHFLEVLLKLWKTFSTWRTIIILNRPMVNDSISTVISNWSINGLPTMYGWRCTNMANWWARIRGCFLHCQSLWRRCSVVELCISKLIRRCANCSRRSTLNRIANFGHWRIIFRCAFSITDSDDVSIFLFKANDTEYFNLTRYL